MEELSVSEVSSKKMISRKKIAVLTLVLLITSITFLLVFNLFFFKFKEVKNKSQSYNKLKETFKFYNNLNDIGTEIYYWQGKSVYKINLNGGKPQLIFTMYEPISGIKLLPSTQKNPSILFTTHIPLDPNSDFKNPISTYWIYSKISPDFPASKSRVSDIVSGLLYNYRPFLGYKKLTTDYVIGVNEDSFGGAELIKYGLNGGGVKIGYLKEKLVNFGDREIKKVHPRYFIPSFDGNLLLSEGFGGGGGGGSAFVVTRDGSKHYDIGFKWYVSNIIWIDNNKLLAENFGKDVKVISINLDGTVTTKEYPEVEFDDFYFSQNALSPDRAYFFNQGYLYEMNNNLTKIALPEKIKKTYFVGWNNNSTKLFATSEKELFSYDIKSGDVEKVAEFYSQTPEWATKKDKMNYFSYENLFDVR